MSATTADITRIVAANGKIDESKEFKFSDYPLVQKQVTKAINEMVGSMTVTIEKGSRKEWLQASKKGDAFLESIMDTSKISKKRLQTMKDKNLDALSAFQSRKVNGMNLSQRVWKYADQYKDQIEQCIDVGLGEGRSADELSRDVRQNLKDPNRLFRRVRDKRGNLVLSKNARAFHPGQGVYRSSYKNAMRLTRSEINMAYRESDFLRWQSLDFVVGFEIHRSNHDPLCKCDICSRLVGRYPKTFKFKGWHPQCLCYTTPILMDEETFDENELGDLKAALRGTQYKPLQAKNLVTDVPDEFKKWVKEHEEAQKGWSSTPYFIKDNFRDGKLSEGLKIDLPTPTAQVDVLAPYRSQIEQARTMATKWGLSIQLTMLEKYVADKDIASIQSRIATIQQKAMQMQQADAGVRRKCAEWGLSTYILDEAMATPDSKNILAKMAELEDRCINAERERKAFISDANDAIKEARKYGIDVSEMLNRIAAISGDKREWTMGKAFCEKALQKLKDQINKAISESGKNIDNPHKGMKTSYTLDSELDETFKVVNSDLSSEKWFEHGDLRISPTKKCGVNGFTYMDGRISLTPDRLARVKTAMAKIGQGKSADITFEEADAMATFWHEITHNRNVPGNCWQTDTQTDVMEMMNEFVARKTLPEFYAKLGCAKTPHPEFINNRDSTGYNRRVVGYDFVIQKLGLDPAKVLASARKNFFGLSYTQQETTAIQALLDGGLDKFKRVDGKPIGKAQLKRIVALCRKGVSTATLENYMRNEGIIK